MKSATRKNLKIGFVFDDSLDRSDGVQQYVKTLGKWFTDSGHEVRYLVGQTEMSNWQGGKVYSLAKNFKVSFNGNKLSIPLPANKKNIKRVLLTEKFDVLHVQTPYSPMMAQKVIMTAEKDTAIFGTFHILPVGVLQSFGTKLLRVWCQRSLKRFDGFFSVSQSAQKFAKSAFKINSEILPNVIDLKRFKPVNGQKKVKPRVVFLGRLVQRKGCEHLIRAVALLGDELDYEFIIAGDGPDRAKLETLAKELRIGHIVSFLGYIREEEKAELLASANIACFPSLYGESFGIVLIEAMASDSEVVLGGNNPGYASVLGDNPKLLFDPKSHEKLAELLNQFLSDDELRQQTKRWQQIHVAQFDVNVVGKKLLQRYYQAVENKAS